MTVGIHGCAALMRLPSMYHLCCYTDQLLTCMMVFQMPFMSLRDTGCNRADLPLDLRAPGQLQVSPGLPRDSVWVTALIYVLCSQGMCCSLFLGTHLGLTHLCSSRPLPRSL